MREIRTLRARRRGLETELRITLLGHEGGNSGHSQGRVLRATAPVLDPTGIGGHRGTDYPGLNSDFASAMSA